MAQQGPVARRKKKAQKRFKKGIKQDKIDKKDQIKTYIKIKNIKHQNQ